MCLSLACHQDGNNVAIVHLGGERHAQTAASSRLACAHYAAHLRSQQNLGINFIPW